MAYKVSLIGGGSGGHVYPLMAVAESLKTESAKRGLDLSLRTLGDGDFIKKASTEFGVSHSHLLRAKWRPYFSILNLIDLLKVPLVFVQSFFYLWVFMPDVVFAKGGYSSFIPVLAAKIFFIPVIIHDSDSIPGKANLMMSRLANHIFVSFDNAKSYFPENKTTVVGNPSRKDLIVLNDKESSASYFSLSTKKPTVLIIGGSQGAQIINQVVFDSLLQLAEKFNIIHQVGISNYEDFNKKVEEMKKKEDELHISLINSSYKIYPFFKVEQLKMAYSMADVIVSRAGAGTLFEVSALGKPIIVIPIKESASGHQKQNAIEIYKHGGTYIEEPNLTTHLLIDQIEKSIQNKDEIKEKLRGFSNPNSAEIIASYLLP